MADAATPDVRKAGVWVIVWGVLLIVAGVLAILAPPIAALAADLLLGWLFVFAGIVQIVYAFQQRGADGFGLKVLSGLLALVLGIFLLLRPIAGIALLIAMGWPQSSIGFVGILVGIVMIYGGVWRIVLGRLLRAGAAPTPA